jgi:hypothetical protein
MVVSDVEIFDLVIARFVNLLVDICFLKGLLVENNKVPVGCDVKAEENSLARV